MIFDTLSAPNLTQLAELWYEQDFYKDTIRVKLGKIDAIENFAFTQSANLMLNSGYETFPNLLGFPTYPNPATGVILVVHPIKYFKLSGALFDGSLIQGFPTGRLGPKLFFNGLGSHAFIISEANILWGKDYKGVIKLGGWGNTASIKRLNNSSQNGTGGGYVIFEQILFQGRGYFVPGTLALFPLTSKVKDNLSERFPQLTEFFEQQRPAVGTSDHSLAPSGADQTSQQTLHLQFNANEAHLTLRGPEGAGKEVVILPKQEVLKALETCRSDSFESAIVVIKPGSIIGIQVSDALLESLAFSYPEIRTLLEKDTFSEDTKALALSGNGQAALSKGLFCRFKANESVEVFLRGPGANSDRMVIFKQEDFLKSLGILGRNSQVPINTSFYSPDVQQAFLPHHQATQLQIGAAPTTPSPTISITPSETTTLPIPVQVAHPPVIPSLGPDTTVIPAITPSPSQQGAPIDPLTPNPSSLATLGKVALFATTSTAAGVGITYLYSQAEEKYAACEGSRFNKMRSVAGEALAISLIAGSAMFVGSRALLL